MLNPCCMNISDKKNEIQVLLALQYIIQFIKNQMKIPVKYNGQNGNVSVIASQIILLRQSVCSLQQFMGE